MKLTVAVGARSLSAIRYAALFRIGLTQEAAFE